MYILLDKDVMCVRYKHANKDALVDLMHIEFPHCASQVMEFDAHVLFDYYSDMELKVLYVNLCGQKYEGFGRDVLLENVMLLIKSLPESELNTYEIRMQAAQIGETDPKNYKYVPGAMQPSILDKVQSVKPLVSNAPFVPVLTSTAPPKAAPAPYTPAAPIVKPAPVPRNTNLTLNANPEAPKSGSKTGRVWEIADGIYATQTKPVDFKLIRPMIVSACEAEGINSSTASVQYGKWKQTKS